LSCPEFAVINNLQSPDPRWSWLCGVFYSQSANHKSRKELAFCSIFAHREASAGTNILELIINN